MRTIIAFLTAILTLLSPQLSAELAAMWSTGVAVPGEQVRLYLLLSSATREPIQLTRRLSIPNASVGQPSTQLRTFQYNNQVASFTIIAFPVTPDRDGNITPGEIEVRYRNGNTEKVSVPPLPVRPTSDIRWMSQKIPGGGLPLVGGGVYDTVEYGCLWYVPEGEGYVDQPVRAQLKLFLPLTPAQFVSPYPPQMQSVGVRIANVDFYGRGSLLGNLDTNLGLGQAFARGKDWFTMNFQGEFTPTQEGQLDIVGKTSICVMRGMGEMEIPLASLKISALPLPPGAPSNFADLVGSYRISSKTDATSLAMHEPVEVEIAVSGSTNIAHIECPEPDDPASWKLMPATRRVVTDANGQVTGVVFTRYMRPVAEVSGIPSFSFSYFDPAGQEYKTAASAPIPLPWRQTDNAASGLVVQNTEPPPAGEVPVAEMTDIYGFIPEGSLRVLSLPRWIWYLLYLPALGVLAYLGLREMKERLRAGASHRLRERELNALLDESKGADFLRSVGSFIESRVPADRMTPELKSILARRDEQAFRPDAGDETISAQEKRHIVKLIRKALSGVAALALALCLGFGSGAEAADAMSPAGEAALPATAASAPSAPDASATPASSSATASPEEAQKAYEGGQFSKAAEMLRSLLEKPSDAGQCPDAALLYYNLGNCEYRLNHPGEAALAYARALQIDPGLKEAEMNLAFVQRKQGAVLPQRSTGDEVFTYLNRSQLFVATIVCTAALLFCIALLLLPGKRPRPWRNFCTGLFLLLSLLCLADWVYYGTRETPDFVAAPPEGLAYVTSDSRMLSAASDSAPAVMRLPASTPLLILAERGLWSYTEAATGARGWVPTADLAPLNPDGGSPRTPMSLRF